MSGMKIGYARVSTDEQTNAAQLAALEVAGCAPIYQEKASSRRHLEGIAWMVRQTTLRENDARTVV